jgi:hypothetical protein
MARKERKLMMSKLLTIDLSTTSTGWAVFDTKTRQLEDFGFLRPDKKGMAKLKYPIRQLLIMRNLADKLEILVRRLNPDAIVVEEVNRHKSRMTGKTLDGMHWIFLDKLLIGEEDFAYRVRFRDSDGPTGWRSRLNLRLGESDKKLNAERKKINKRKVKGTADLPIINKKHLAARYVNSALGLTFDVDKNATDNDVVDAIGMGLSELLTMK